MKRRHKILVTLLVVGVVAGVGLYIRQKAREKAVGFTEEAALITENIEGKGRKTVYRFSAAVDATPQDLYDCFINFASWREFVPDISYVKVVESTGNTRVVEMRRYILFLGRELGGRLQYTLHPEELAVEMRTLNNPHAEVYEKWEFLKAPQEGKSVVRYFADTVSATQVPLVMARAWMKDNFVGLVNALRERVQRAQG